jgi:hypothetical protein
VVAHHEQHADRDADRDAGPDDLADARAVPAVGLVCEVDAIDHGDAQPVEHRDDRQDQGVGIRGDYAHREVHGEHESAEQQ